MHLLGDHPTIIANCKIVVTGTFAPRLKVATSFTLEIMFGFATRTKGWAANALASQGSKSQATPALLKQVPNLFGSKIHVCTPNQPKNVRNSLLSEDVE
jgi:hypothetical protein